MLASFNGFSIFLFFSKCASKHTREDAFSEKSQAWEGLIDRHKSNCYISHKQGPRVRVFQSTQSGVHVAWSRHASHHWSIWGTRSAPDKPWIHTFTFTSARGASFLRAEKEKVSVCTYKSSLFLDTKIHLVSLTLGKPPRGISLHPADSASSFQVFEEYLWRKLEVKHLEDCTFPVIGIIYIYWKLDRLCCDRVFLDYAFLSYLSSRLEVWISFLLPFFIFPAPINLVFAWTVPKYNLLLRYLRGETYGKVHAHIRESVL